MKSVILALGTVLVLGCVEQPSSRSVSEPPSATVFDELAAAVRGALAAKRVEDNRLAQLGVEKQRLVSRLMPNGDWADGHPLAIEGYVSKRDPEGAKNLSVVLDREFMAAEAGPLRYPPVPRAAVGARKASSSDTLSSSKTDQRAQPAGFQGGSLPSNVSTAARPIPQSPSGHPHHPSPTMIAPQNIPEYGNTRR
jgi:hypothetical protein